MSDHTASRQAPDDLAPLIADWPGQHALVVGDADQVFGTAGDLDVMHRIASVTKLFASYATLIAVEEGTVELDDPAGPAGSTVRHLLAHASGLGFDEPEPVASVGSRRVYSNVGIEALAAHLASKAGMDFADYLRLGVLEPLGLGHVNADVSPAHGLRMSANDLAAFAVELLRPTLLSPATLAEATTPVWPDLRGVLPGFGPMHPNPWGLGFEIRGDKAPHWTAPGHSPRTFGHFGGSGSFLWIDPERHLFGLTVGDQAFGLWAETVWAPTNQAILDRYAYSTR